MLRPCAASILITTDVSPAGDPSNIRHITGGYFQAMQVPIVEGRAIDARDTLDAPPVCMVSASFARQFWPNSSALGHTVRRTGATAKWMTIVGVAADVMDAGAGINAGPTLYSPYLQTNTSLARVSLVMRTAGDPLAFAGAVQRAIWSVDPAQAVDGIGRLDDVMVQSAGDHRFRTVLLAMFAAIGLTLAIVGVYGVTAAAVISRTREMGVRLALGARPSQVVAAILRETMTRVGAGAAAGAIAFAAAASRLSGLLYDTHPASAPVIGGAVALMCAGALIAAYLRARPLASLPPVVAIRQE